MALPKLRALRPSRSLAFPFAATLYPQLWFVFRDTGFSAVSHPTTAELLTMLPRILALTAGAIAVSYLVAFLVVRVLNPDSRDDSLSGWKRLLFRPSNTALVAFALISIALGTYLVTASTLVFPQEVETLVRLLGVVIGWPLLVVYGGMVILSNAFVGEPTFLVQAVVVGIGVALSTTWLFFLSGWFANFVDSAPGSSTPPTQ
ncbi:hypothetical protein [Haladaptatus cibarius]|uniref:hypothetical protein n=1 Tax=Haladaptatus cibarius TaxID=453847 RepID=UPI000679DF77|nr:hypothetical protein [Haladaptatus cibarius]